jgi:RNA polymerase sigma factor for flagellar operon FliA
MAVRLRHRLPPYVSVDDLVGAGFVGLILAYGRYDPARCDQFEGYAKWRIRGAMLDEIRSYDHLSRDLRAFATRMNAATRRLQTKLGRPPTEAEVADDLGLSIDTLRTCAAVIALGPAVSIDAVHGDDGSPAEPFDPWAVTAEEKLARSEARRSISAAVEALPARLREVLQLYYGEEQTLRHIGDQFGVTESRACQLRAEAIARLRAASAD